MRDVFQGPVYLYGSVNSDPAEPQVPTKWVAEDSD
jgi:hypothetical protein